MTHDDARLALSARLDGEPYDTAELATHLDACAECTAYAADLDRLRTLTAALPRAHAPASLETAVRQRIRRRNWLRLAPVVAAATAVVLVVLTLWPAGPGTFPLPPAAAADGLLRLRSFYVERTVTQGRVTRAERIWWRAPGYLRIESGGSVYVETPRTGTPHIALPEPLSPAIALLGQDTGAGPTIAGRPTRRYVLAVGGETRTAYVDAAGVAALGGTESVVLTKLGGPAVKTTQVVRYNPDLPDSLFTGAAGPGEFKERPLGSLAVAPRRIPRGFSLVRAGRGTDDVALFARGSLPILATTAPLSAGQFAEARTVRRGGVTYPVVVDLYGAPGVQVRTARGVIAVYAPLPLDSLVTLALDMYGE